MEIEDTKTQMSSKTKACGKRKESIMNENLEEEIFVLNKKLAIVKGDENTKFKSPINFNSSLTCNIREKIHNKIFSLMDFDKLCTIIKNTLTFIYLGFLSNFFPHNNLEFILRKMEIKRVTLLKRRKLNKVCNSFDSPRHSKDFASIHAIDNEFIHDGNIKINKKFVDQFKMDKKKSSLNKLYLKKDFFKRKEETPEDIKKYFREKMKKGFYQGRKTISVNGKLLLKKIGIFVCKWLKCIFRKKKNNLLK